MRNRLLSLAALLLLMPAFSFAIGAYKMGDKLTVHAQSGLILRKTPDPKGTAIVTIPYGEQVTVSKVEGIPKTHEAFEFTNYKIRGFWIKVKNKSGQEGFVFDGYLSSYPIAGNLINEPNEAAGCTAEGYLMLKSTKKGVRKDIPKVGGQYEHYTQAFKNGASMEFTGGEGGSSQIIFFEKGITMEEAYLIGKGLWLKDMKVKAAFKDNKIIVNSQDELWQITVENKAGMVILTMSHAD